MKKPHKIAIISTGNGGQALAAYFAYYGAEVSLYAREQARVEMFVDNEFKLGGILEATVKINSISCNMQEVIKGAELIMVTTPAQYHLDVAREMAAYLEDNQVVVLNPGRSFGTCVFAKVLNEVNPEKHVILAEADTFIFTCRCQEIAHPIIYKIKDNLRIAAHRAEDTAQVVEMLSHYFDGVEEAGSVLETAVGNMGMIFHPLPVLMNLTRIEKKEVFRYYHEAISPLVAQVLERLDQERVLIGKTIGVRAVSAQQWLQDKYGVEGNSLYERIQNTEAYSDVYAPTELNTRYIFEDIPTGIVPMLALGKRFNLKLPVMEGLSKWAMAVYERDFYKAGRNEEVIDFDELLK